MPRYFFNIRDGRDIFDTTGTELGSLKEVRRHMLRAATDLGEEAGGTEESWEMEVLDESGKIVFTMDFTVTTSKL